MYKFEPFYRAKVEKVTDGDTLVISFYLGLGIWLNDQKVRLLGINAPEKTGETRELGLKVTEYLKGLLRQASGVIIRSDEAKKGKYGRFLVVVYGKIDGEWVNINQKLVEVGAAQEYMVASDASEAEEIFNPPPQDIENRVMVDEVRTEQEVYQNGAEVIAAMVVLAKEVAGGEKESIGE